MGERPERTAACTGFAAKPANATRSKGPRSAPTSSTAADAGFSSPSEAAVEAAAERRRRRRTRRCSDDPCRSKQATGSAHVCWSAAKTAARSRSASCPIRGCRGSSRGHGATSASRRPSRSRTSCSGPSSTTSAGRCSTSTRASTRTPACRAGSSKRRSRSTWRSGGALPTGWPARASTRPWWSRCTAARCRSCGPPERVRRRRRLLEEHIAEEQRERRLAARAARDVGGARGANPPADVDLGRPVAGAVPGLATRSPPKTCPRARACSTSSCAQRDRAGRRRGPVAVRGRLRCACTARRGGSTGPSAIAGAARGLRGGAPREARAPAGGALRRARSRLPSQRPLRPALARARDHPRLPPAGRVGAPGRRRPGGVRAARAACRGAGSRRRLSGAARALMADPPEARRRAAVSMIRRAASARACATLRERLPGRSVAATPRARLRVAAVPLRVPARRRVGGGDRQPHDARDAARRLGARPGRAATGGSWRCWSSPTASRARLHGGDRARSGT